MNKNRPPRLGTLGQAADAAVVRKSKDQVIDPARTSRTPGRINLKAVAEVLSERGLDPTEEIIKLLMPRFSADGSPMPDVLDADVKARMWNELLQYTQPKLKSVEVKAKIAAAGFDVSDDQAKRLAEEFLKAAVE